MLNFAGKPEGFRSGLGSGQPATGTQFDLDCKASLQHLKTLAETALTLSVHADALQAAVSGTEQALQAMQLDNAAMDEIADQMAKAKRELVKSQEVDALRSKYVSSSSGKEEGGGRTGASQPVVGKAGASTSPLQGGGGKRAVDPLAFAKNAVEEGDLLSIEQLRQRPGGIEESTDVTKSDHTIRILTQIDMLRAKMAKLERSSVNYKLRDLQKAKAEAAITIKKLPTIHDTIDNFEFPLEAQKMFVSGAQVSPEIVGNVIDNAIKRLSVRVCDALNLITKSASSDDPMQIHAASCYATLAKDPDVNFALQVANLDPNALADHFEFMEKRYRERAVSSPFSYRSNDRNVYHNDPEGEEAVDEEENGQSTTSSSFLTTSLSPLYHSFVPQSFLKDPRHKSNEALLASVGAGYSPQLLPPAKHILTPRFSFENRNELRRLEKLRWELQAALIKLHCTNDAMEHNDEALVHHAPVNSMRNHMLLKQGGRSWPVLAREGERKE